MSSVYKNLTDDDLKFEKETLKSLEKNLSPNLPSNRPLKVAIILAFIISLISLVGSISIYQSLNKERRERLALQASQEGIQEKAKIFSEAAAKSSDEAAKLQQVIQTYKQDQISMRKELDKTTQELTKFRTKLSEVEERTMIMQKAAEEIQLDFESLDDPLPTVSTSKQPSAPEKKAAPPPPAASASVTKNAQVLTVNRKFNFVVVNIGIKEGVKMGDNLTVERAGSSVGLVTVEKLYDNFSAATIMKESKDAPIKDGDAVIKA